MRKLFGRISFPAGRGRRLHSSWIQGSSGWKEEGKQKNPDPFSPYGESALNKLAAASTVCCGPAAEAPPWKRMRCCSLPRLALWHFASLDGYSKQRLPNERRPQESRKWTCET